MAVNILFQKLEKQKPAELKFYNKDKKIIFKVIADPMLIGFPALLKSEKNNVTMWASPAIVKLLDDNDKEARRLVLKALNTVELTSGVKSEDDVVDQTLESLTDHELM